MSSMRVPSVMSTHGATRKRIVRARWIGALIIIVYWSSFFWLKPLFAAFGVLPLRSGVVAKVLTLCFTPPLKLLKWMDGFLPYPEYLFYGPLLAVVAPLVLTLALWWTCLTIYLRR